MDFLNRYGFTLHKWFSNYRNIMASRAHVSHDFSKNQNVRTLGIQWSVNEDSFLYTVRVMTIRPYLTKEACCRSLQGFTTRWVLSAPLRFGANILYNSCGWRAQVGTNPYLGH